MATGLVLLGMTAGAADAFTLLSGQVFASVMTGNLVLLGLSASSRNGSLGLHAGVSLGGYVVGALFGVRGCRPETGSRWPSRVVLLLGAELVLLATVAVARAISVGRPSSSLETALLALASTAMGLQSAVGRVAPGGPGSTTYLTGALTELLAALSTGEWSGREWNTLAVLVAALFGAGAETALVLFAPRVAPVLMAAVVAGVLILVHTQRRHLAAS